MVSPVRFLFNNDLITLSDIDPNLTLLQYLRDVQLATGTKEGCASGDCGACTVVVVDISETSSTELTYTSINACITFVTSLHGKQLITIEHLKEAEKLHQIQQSFVNNHGSQCGFCTPGFVMSCFALHKNNAEPRREDVVENLSGNLCRCTGYRAIIDGALETTKNLDDVFRRNHTQTLDKLKGLKEGPSVRFETGDKKYFAPKSIAELAVELLANPDSTLMAGATDLALNVTQNFTSFKKTIYLGDVKELTKITESLDQIIIGSAVPYSQFQAILEKEYPDFKELIERLGAKQVRNKGTLGGNIGNASPIGDMPPALIVLGAKMILQRGSETRTVKVEEYFISYKKTVLREAEFIKEIIIPKAKSGHQLKLYKISKRFDDDISAVLAAIYIRLEDDQVTAIRLAFGGMAATPKRASHSEQVLLNKAFTEQNIVLAQQQLVNDFQPLSDVRASVDYRMRVAQNLLMKCYFELTDNELNTRVTHYA